MSNDFRYTILIVDDEIIYANYLKKVFARQRPNWTILEAHDGLEALEVVKSNRSIDTAIIDLKMPHMGGYEFLEKLVENNQNICSIISTAYGDMTTIANAFKLGAYDFLTKPIDTNKLIATIDEGIAHVKMVNLSQEVLTRLDSEQVFEIVLEIAELRFQPIAGGLVILDSEQQEAVIKRAFIKQPEKHILNQPMNRAMKKLLKPIFETGLPQRLDDIAEHKAGTLSKVTRSFLGVPIKMTGGVVRGVLLIESDRPNVYDIRSQHILIMLASNAAIALHNAELAEKLKKGEHEFENIKFLAASVAHEIRNSLQPALTIAGLLCEQEWLTCLDSKGQLKTIQNCLLETDSLMNDLLDLTRTNQEEKKQEELNAIIEESIWLLKEIIFQNNIKIEKKLRTKLPEVECNRDQMQRVFRNLIKNSVDSINEKQVNGKLLIQTALDEKKEFVIASIKDNGTGIKKENLPHIFDRYYTSKIGRKAFGIGLAFARKVVEETHHGRIEVTSEPGSGTEFRIYLPLIR